MFMRLRSKWRPAHLPAVIAALIAAAVLVPCIGWQLRTLSLDLFGEHNWRQADTYSVAYNFRHESHDFFHPRIDWNSGRSGIMGMEMPLYSYLVFLASYVLGDRAETGRMVTWVLFAVVFFFAGFAFYPKRSRHYVFCFWATLALSPMAMFEFRQVQPDPAMVAMAVGAAVLLRKHALSPRWPLFIGGLALYTCAVLTKGPALFLGPAMVLLSLSRPVPWRNAAARVAAFAAPVLAWYLWNQWAHHLNHVYNNDEVYFAIEFNKKAMLDDLTNVRQVQHILWFILPVYACNWTLMPALLAGLALSFHSEHREVGFPMRVWLAGSLLFLLLFSSRLTSHWYYAVLAVPPITYFTGLGLGCLFETFKTISRTDVAFRWAILFVLGCFALTRMMGGAELTLTRVPGSTGAVPSSTWCYEVGFSVLVMWMTFTIGLAMRRLRPWEKFALPVASLCGLGIALPRAEHDMSEVLRWRTRYEERDEQTAKLRAIREAVDQYSTRKDLFLVDIGQPYYLYMPRRKGFAQSSEEIRSRGLEYYKARGVRFFLHYQEAGQVVPAAHWAPIAQAGSWALYCIDDSGCPGSG